MKYAILILFVFLSSIKLCSQTNYQYDNLNRLIQVEYADGTIETFTYDEVGNRMSCVVTGINATVDLSFQSQSAATSSLSPGDNVAVTYSIGNSGNSAAGAQKTYIYLSTNSSYDAGVDIEVGCQYVSGIGANGTASYTTNITIPGNTNAANYYLVLFTDGDTQVSETDETNNEAYIPITVSGTGLPNLLIELTSISVTNIAAGASTVLQYNYVNNSAVDAGASQFKCFLSNDINYDAADIVVRTLNVSSSLANSSVPKTSTITIPASTPSGTYYLLLYADVNGVISETNESDNIYPVAINVSNSNANAPIADFTASITSICTGQSIQFIDASTNSPISWSWSFSGGSPASSTAQNPVVVFPNAGTYTMTLTVTNANGSDTETKTGYIVVGSNAGGGSTSADWEWAKNFGSTSYDESYATAIDGSGNIIMYGYATSTGSAINFGNGVSVTPSAYLSFCVAKFDSNGDAIWAKLITSNNNFFIYDVVTDNSGNIYLSGETGGTVDFGGSTFTGSSVAPSAMLAKLNASGTAQWSIGSAYSTTNYASARTIACDGTNIYISGHFDNAMTLGSSSVTSYGQEDIFISKINGSGTVQWLKRFGSSTDNDRARDILFDGTNIVITGHFRGTANFGGTSLSSSGTNDIFIAQYNTSGTLQFVDGVGSSTSDYGFGLGADASGNIYMTGYFTGTINFGGSTYTIMGNRESLVAKYSNSGVLDWVKVTSTSAGGITTGTDLIYDGNYMVFSGVTNSMNSFDGTPINTANAGANFLIFLDDTGAIVAQEVVDQITDSGTSEGNSHLSTDGMGATYMIGRMQNTLTLGSDVLSSNGSYDMLLAKYVSSGGSVTCNLSAPTITANGSTIICSNGGSVELAAPSGYTYQWSDGTTTQNNTVNQAGAYDVTITDCAGCTATSNSITVIISQDAVPSNATITDETCNNQDGAIALSMSNQQNVTIAWNGGSMVHAGNSGNATISTLSAATYDVTITDSANCTYENTYIVGQTGTYPTASFTTSIAATTVTFTNTSSNATSQTWDFDDGNTSTQANPVHSFVGDGTYNVCLTVTNSCGSQVSCIEIEIENCLIVTNTNDSGTGSLREAINCANSNTANDLIMFSIPGAGPHIISLASDLPFLIDDGIVIDATTQPAYSAGGIVIDGNGNDWGIVLLADNCEVYGLSIHNFVQTGLYVSGDNFVLGAVNKGNTVYNCYFGVYVNGGNNGIIQGNKIGVNESATTVMGLVAHGIRTINVNGLLIGGNNSGEGNVIGGSPYAGIGIGDYGYSDSNYQIIGNFIGTDPTGVLDFGNTNSGIDKQPTVAVTDILIEDNTIAYNGIYGVWAYDAPCERWTITQNRTYCNDSGGIGINNGANNAIVSPIITSATSNLIQGTAVAGQVIEVFVHDENLCTHPCQGKTYLGNTTVDASGNWSLSGTFVPSSLTTSTATDTNGNTSEFSACAEVENCLLVTNTNDSGSGSLREAINCANANPSLDFISFDIPGAAPHIISVNTVLPSVADDGVIIDATTQPSWSLGDIVIDGTALASGNGINSSANNLELYGLKIQNFPSYGIASLFGDNVTIGEIGKGNVVVLNSGYGLMLHACDNCNIYANYIGVLEDGITTAPNQNGIFSYYNTNINIGKQNGGNIISANTTGIVIGTSSSSEQSYNINYNFIGTNPSGDNLGNQGVGIFQNGSTTADNIKIYHNTIAYNQYGIYVQNSNATNWDPWNNSFYCNDLDDIRLLGNANSNIQPPIITNASTTQISGTLTMPYLGTQSYVELRYADEECLNKPCQGRTFIEGVTPDASGSWILTGSFIAGKKVLATQSFSNNGEIWTTSGFSSCVTIQSTALVCDDYNLVLSNSENTTYYYTAENTIVSTSEIQTSADIAYIAGQSIRLSRGFHAVSGSEFHAYIDDCTPASLSTTEDRMAAKEVEQAESASLTITPNPFDEITNIEYYLPSNTNIQIAIYDLSGRLVKMIEEGYFEQGVYQLKYDGSPLAKGMYIAILQTDSVKISKKILVV